MAVDVSILLPASDRVEPLAAALDALAAHLPPHGSHELVVIANRPTREVRALLATRRELTALLSSPVDLGVAGAFNLGRTRARGRFLALLHDDSVVEPGWLEALLDAAAARPDAGVFASLVLHPDGTLQSAGSLVWREGFTTLRWPVGSPPPLASFRELEPIDYAGTCGLLVRTELFDAVGGLDEELFPGFYVGVELCLAARRLRRGVLLVPGSRVRHAGGGHLSDAERRFVTDRNRARFVAKRRAELEKLPSSDLAPAGYEAANRRVRLWGRALEEEFRAAPLPLVPRFQLDPEEQRRRLRRLGAEVGVGFRVWQSSAQTST